MADEQKAAPVQQKPSMQKQQAAEINIVRIAGKDIDGSLSIKMALMRVKGIGYNMAHSIADIAEKKFGIKVSETIGSLNEERIVMLESVIKDPGKFGVPAYLLNRRRGPGHGSGNASCGNRPHGQEQG